MRPQIAARQIELFQRRYGPAHLLYAYHAALPLALTPDLAYRIWWNFQRDVRGAPLGAPWVAGADLLLSALCREVGRELYGMDEEVRRQLLDRLRADARFGEPRLRALSAFLLDHVERLRHSDDIDARVYGDAQRWVALAHLRPEDAVYELAAAAAAAAGDRAEWLRLSALVERVAVPISRGGDDVRSEFERLRSYSKGMASLAQGEPARAEAHFAAASPAAGGRHIEISGVRVALPAGDAAVGQVLSSQAPAIARAATLIAEIEITTTSGGFTVANLLMTSPTAGLSETLAESVPVALDQTALLEMSIDPAAYGAALSRMLFADERMRTVWQQVRMRAAGASAPIQILLRLGADDEIDRLFWETLRDPLTGAALATDPQVRLSRFEGSPRVRPALNRRDQLRALLIAASPTDLDRYQLAPFDVEGAIALMQGALTGVALTVQRPATWSDTIQSLHAAQPDIVCYYGYGTKAKGEAFFWFESDDGRAAPLPGADLVGSIAGMKRPPTLVVLTGAEELSDHVPHAAAVGPALVRAGVSHVVTFGQGTSIAFINRFLTVMLAETMVDGLVDRAVTAARLDLAGTAEWWRPLLYSGSRDSRVWQEKPGSPPPPEPAPPADAELARIELAVASREGGYALSLRLVRSQDAGEFIRGPYPTSLNLDVLRELSHDAEKYGMALGDMLFAGEARQAFREMGAVALGEGQRADMQLVLPPELQPLHWEAIRDPETGASLALDERLLLSRYVPSTDYEPITLRAVGQLRVLAAVSSPADIARFGRADIDRADEIQQIDAALHGVPLTMLGGPDGKRATWDGLSDQLRAGCDILYLVAHGVLRSGDGEPHLFFERDTGKSDIRPCSALADLVRSLGARRPRLVILSLLARAGEDEGTVTSAALSVQLCQAGVPAVLALQGGSGLSRAFMALFLPELLRTGRADEALGAARAAAADQGPALYTRLRGGRLWIPAGTDAAPQRYMHISIAGLAPDEALPSGAESHLLIWLSAEPSRADARISRPLGPDLGPAPAGSLTIELGGDPAAVGVRVIDPVLDLADGEDLRNSAEFAITPRGAQPLELTLTASGPDGIARFVERLELPVGPPPPPPPPALPARIMIMLVGQPDTIRADFLADGEADTKTKIVAQPTTHQIRRDAVVAASRRARLELARLAYAQQREGERLRYPFASDATLAVDPALARASAVPLATAGRALYELLVPPGTMGDQVRQAAPGSRLRVETDDWEGLIPWTLLYDRPGPITPATLSWSGFWGHRFVIAMGDSAPRPPISAEAGPAVLLLADAPDLRAKSDAQVAAFALQDQPAPLIGMGQTAAITFLREPAATSLIYLFAYGDPSQGLRDTRLSFDGQRSIGLHELRAAGQGPLPGQPLVVLNAGASVALAEHFYRERRAGGVIYAEAPIPTLLAEHLALGARLLIGAQAAVAESLWQLRRDLLDSTNNPLALAYGYVGQADLRPGAVDLGA